MQKSEVKTIAFKGIERINERINCNDGACEEIINLRPEGNTWHNIGKRKQITQNGLSVSGDVDYSVIIHPASKDKYYIVWDKTHGKIILYDSQTEKIKQILLNTDNIISVSYLDNVLIVCTQDKKYYFLYDAQTQDYKAISFNNVSANITAKSNPLVKQEDYTSQKYSYIGETAVYNTGLMIQYLPAELYTIYRTRDKGTITDYKQLTGLSLSAFSEAVKSFLGTMEENIREGKQSAKKLNNVPYISIEDGRKIFKGLSFYRVAFKPYDGSYVNYSNISYADTNGDDATMDNYGSFLNAFPISFKCDTDGSHVIKSGSGDYSVYLRSVATYNPFGTHKVTIDLQSSFADIKTLMDNDIIQSIDVFMTRPVFSVDLDKDINLTDTYAYTQISGNGIFKQGDDISAVACFEGIFPRNDEGIRNQLFSGAYFKVKSFDKDDVNKISDGILSYEIVYEDIKTLEANTILPTPATDNEVLFESSYNYNQRQHLYNILYNIFKGYDLPQDNISTGAFALLVNTINHNQSLYGLYYTVKGEYNGESFAIKHKINNPDRFIFMDFLAGIQLPNLFSYPMIDKITFGIYIFYQNGDVIKLFEKKFDNIFAGGNTNFICSLKNKDDKYFTKYLKHIEFKYNSVQLQTYLPTSADNDSHFNSLTQIIDFSDLKITSFKEILQTSNKNILQLTETDNPFVLPSAENYAFGEKGNEILAISSNSGLTTDRNFGTYPLYVFTTDGVYTMAVGSGNVAYSNIIQLNTTQIINKNVLNTPLGVMFLSKRGLCIINGRQIQCISDLIKGNPTITSDDNRGKLLKLAPDSVNPVTFQKIKDLSAIVDLDALTPQDDDFLSEILTSQFYYDEVHNEVCIVVKEKYTYVFNLSLSVFYKRSDYFQVESGRILSTKTLYEQELNPKQPTINPNNPFSFNQGSFHGGNLQMDRTKTLIHLFSFDEQFSEDEDICKSIAIITKPFLLDTRNFKHIERTIFNMSWKTRDDFYLVIFVSQNGVDYSILKQYHQISEKDNVQSKQDIYLSRALRSCKYIMVWICSRNITNTRIANIIMEFQQVRTKEGIR